MNGDDPNPCLVEDLLVGPFRMTCVKPMRYEIVVAEPENPKRQEERILITSRVTDPYCTENVFLINQIINYYKYY